MTSSQDNFQLLFKRITELIDFYDDDEKLEDREAYLRYQSSTCLWELLSVVVGKIDQDAWNQRMMNTIYSIIINKSKF